VVEVKKNTTPRKIMNHVMEEGHRGEN